MKASTDGNFYYNGKRLTLRDAVKALIEAHEELQRQFAFLEHIVTGELDISYCDHCSDRWFKVIDLGCGILGDDYGAILGDGMSYCINCAALQYDQNIGELDDEERKKWKEDFVQWIARRHKVRDSIFIKAILNRDAELRQRVVQLQP